jgi:hypothetical protein
MLAKEEVLSTGVVLAGDEISGASFSVDRVYRYSLWRYWDDSLLVAAFVMLNPSTADEVDLDPTVRRCVGYARSWKCGGLIVGNIFALRSTDPKQLYRVEDPVGPSNDLFLRGLQEFVDITIFGWGTRGRLNGRGRAVDRLFGYREGVFCLGTTRWGEPIHPLYQRADLKPIRFEYKERPK